MSYLVVVTRRAARQITLADTWWRENRIEAPDRLIEELDYLFASLVEFPARGRVWRGTPTAGDRFIVLPRVGYRVVASAQSRDRPGETSGPRALTKISRR